MSVIKAKFDGQVFVPREAVRLPVGTQVDVVLPTTDAAGAATTNTPPPAPTADGDAEWSRIRAEIAATEPAFPTVEDAMRYSRKRP